MSIVSDVTATYIRDAIARRKVLIMNLAEFTDHYSDDFRAGMIKGLEIAEKIADDNID